MKSCFWSRWHLEYLTNLQQKHKWNDPDHPLKVDDLVIIKQDNLSPLQWRMARVVELHPGLGKVARVATVKTSSGTYKRPINKLCLLPQN
ncbi:hypothetical protein JTB14_005890 [Gonioctena quinquepunctata]|nr:hypothetical protein JTB14_005890 [Gonioctena quinquepunctata]